MSWSIGWAAHLHAAAALVTSWQLGWASLRAGRQLLAQVCLWHYKAPASLPIMSRLYVSVLPSQHTYMGHGPLWKLV